MGSNFRVDQRHYHLWTIPNEVSIFWEIWSLNLGQSSPLSFINEPFLREDW